MKKKVTVRKIITSGSDMDSLFKLDAETEIQNESDDDRVIMHKYRHGEPGTIRIEKHITRGDGTDSDDSNCHHRKIKKNDKRHQKSYIIEEEKTIKKKK